MKARPILFSAEMVRAILAGHKTQTRRVVKPYPYKQCINIKSHGDEWLQVLLDGEGKEFTLSNIDKRLKCPYGKASDLLWVRETFGFHETFNEYVYRATDDPDRMKKWKPSIFMPRAASRITLEITKVRVEPLQDIAGFEAFKEGVGGERDTYYEARQAYKVLWDKINGVGAWNANPWVWVIEFEPNFCNVDDLIERNK